jgi:beta-mannosidase
MMQTQTLNGFWQVRAVDTNTWYPASVPGGVHTDLMAAGVIPDPLVGENEAKVQWVAEKNWEYRRFFYPSASLFRQEKIWLVCDGLDTLAEVRLNGKFLGQANNMYRTWRWDVKSLLLEGENKLEVRFRSPVAYARARERVRRLRAMNMGIAGGAHLRKSPSHFGWDWGPRFACMGIWKEIRLESAARGQLGEIRLDQEHAPGMVTLTARVQADVWEASEARFTTRLRITGPDRQVWLLDAPARAQSAMSVTIANPQLWWPNGYGPQTLYAVEVELLDGDERLLDSRRCAIGLRTVRLDRDGQAPAPAPPAQGAGSAASGQPAETNASGEPAPAGAPPPASPGGGESFRLVVNGQPIFCKGANWIPADAFPARVTPQHLEGLIRAAAQAHFNMLRVWGGGVYESDAFYDLCDRYGLLVWQDCMFSCATYPLDDASYCENALAEVAENAQRLRHHPSLALWCGNNEVEWLGGRFGWFRREEIRQAHRRFFFEALPGVLAQVDPGRPYWPGSPSSGEPFHEPGSHQAGDAHLWEVYHEFRTPAHYRSQSPRFASEFGFQALPAPATVQQFFDPDRKPDSTAPARDGLVARGLARHQRAVAGGPRLDWYLAQRFRLPRTLDGLIYLSQVYQAEAVREAVEHWRRQPEQTAGALYWQLNDCWPVTSWSSVDYYGRWKALHFAARRFFAPVALSLKEDASRSRHAVQVWVSADGCVEWQGRVHWTLETMDGQVITGGDQSVSAGIRKDPSASCALTLDFSAQNVRMDPREVVFTAVMIDNAGRMYPTGLAPYRVVAFLPEKSLRMPAPELQAEVDLLGDDRLLVRVRARRLARFVELSLAGADGWFSDNYFDLPAGRQVAVECALPPGWDIDQARAALRLRSLADAGPLEGALATRWRSGTALLQTAAQTLWHALRSV